MPCPAPHAREALSRAPRSEAARRGGSEPRGPSRGLFPPPLPAVRALRAARESSRTEVRGALENVAVVLSAGLRAGFGDGATFGSGSALPFDLKAATKAGGCREAVPELRAALLTHPGAALGCAGLRLVLGTEPGRHGGAGGVTARWESVTAAVDGTEFRYER